MDGKLHHLKEELRNLIKCPITCEIGTRLEPISCHLYSLWDQIKAKHAFAISCPSICAESAEFETPYSPSSKDDEIEEIDSILDPLSVELDLELIQTVEEAKKELGETKFYIEKAKEEFFKYASIFECKVANQEEYPKHYPLKKEKKIKIIDKTKGKDMPSLFFPGIRDKELDWVLVLSMEDAFWRLIKEETQRIAVDCICPIGASKGKETDHIYFEFNRSSKIAHAYPVLKEEIPSYILVTNCDSLQGCAEL